MRTPAERDAFLAEAAMRFYREADSPSEAEMERLFGALLHNNVRSMVELLNEHGIEAK